MGSRNLIFFVLFCLLATSVFCYKRRENRERCPRVKAIRNFEISEMMGFWYVVQYYSSSEDTQEYSCMRSNFSMSAEAQYHVTMNFTYIFEEDPWKSLQNGNLTWNIPNFTIPAAWRHIEDSYEGVYNTYVLDTDYKSWALIMHCAEKSKSPRYLSALMLSRKPNLQNNVVNFLREKLPRYDIDISFMFEMDQANCTVDKINEEEEFTKMFHPMKPVHEK